MEIRTGVDIIEVNRIKESIEQIGQVFVDRIFTEKEQEYCEKSNKMKYQHYAARFAAKEAFVKASGKKDIKYNRVEILDDTTGRPHLYVDGVEVGQVSLTHDFIASAIVLLDD